jgi:glutamate-1-semialdehyde 2,1-aminomutase
MAERMERLVREGESGHTGMGTTLSGSALAMAAMRVNLEQVMTQSAYDHMLPLAKRLAEGVSAAIAQRDLPWHVSQVGARAEFVCSARPPRNGSEAAAAMHGELENVIHLFLLNRGVAITPFHNMTLVSPATAKADVERLVSVLGDCLDELLAD